MPAAPRMRQLRRDKTLFSMVMNVVRLQLENADQLARQPHLREQPDADLLRVRQGANHWLGLATGYVMQKHRCYLDAALRLVEEMRDDLQAGVPPTEVRQVPVSDVLNSLPPDLRDTLNTAPGT